MQMKFSKSVAGVFAGSFLVHFAEAHPGHAPTDLAAQVSQPFAGLDHMLAFAALTSILLTALAVLLKLRNIRTKNRSN